MKLTALLLLAGCAQFPVQSQMTPEQIKAAADAGIVCVSSYGGTVVYVNIEKTDPRNAEVTIEPAVSCKISIRTVK